MSLLGALVRNTPWQSILDLLSPAFFDVVPARMLLGEVRKLASRYRSDEAFRDAKADRARRLRQAGLPFELVDTLPGGPVVMNTERGDAVLALYFHQVLGQGPTLLDLRKAAFERAGDRWQWKPAPAIAIWDEDFREGCRDLYFGYYRDDPTRFSRGAHALGLGLAQDELRAQFGDPTSVKFSLRDFQDRFHAVFERCKATKSRIHPGFLTLGLNLATMYEHLEAVGQPLDVRAAFERVTSASPPPPA